MRRDVNGIPIGQLADCWATKFKPIPKIYTTTARKLKTNHGYKIRLCLRDDLQEETQVQFASDPTVGRDFLKLFLSLYSLHPSWSLCTVEITKARTQGDYANSADRCIAIFPPYLNSNSHKWEGWVAASVGASEFERDFDDSDTKRVEVHPAAYFESAKGGCGLLLFRPLYGSHDASLRRWLSISTCLRKSGFTMLRADCCVLGAFSTDPKM